jgi:hypothetical protein
MALGAQRLGVLAHVMKEGLVLVIAVDMRRAATPSPRVSTSLD